MERLFVAVIFIISSVIEANNVEGGLDFNQTEVSEQRMSALEGQVVSNTAELAAMEIRLMEKLENIRNEAQLEKVFFTVCVDTDFGSLSKSVIKFDKIIAQSGGSNYNRDTGEFICPRHGIYYFQFTSAALSSTFNVNGIQKNGQFIARQLIITPKSNSVDASSVGGATECLQGDKVFVYSRAHQKFNKGCFHTFTGFMIHAL